jgi:hypothetical protein
MFLLAALKLLSAEKEKNSSARAGLPDGLFSNQKSKFGQNWEGLGKENGVILCAHLGYFTAIWYNLWPFGRYSLWSFGIFFSFGMCWTKKNLATLRQSKKTRAGNLKGT